MGWPPGRTFNITTPPYIRIQFLFSKIYILQAPHIELDHTNPLPVHGPQSAPVITTGGRIESGASAKGLYIYP